MDYLKCEKIDTAIRRAKKMLIDRVKKDGVYENFGSKEVKEIKSKFIDNCDYSEVINSDWIKLLEFEFWCIGYAQQ